MSCDFLLDDDHKKLAAKIKVGPCRKVVAIAHCTCGCQTLTLLFEDDSHVCITLDALAHVIAGHFPEAVARPETPVNLN